MRYVVWFERSLAPLMLLWLTLSCNAVFAATPLAHFALDETGLNGSAGELSDSQGNFNAAYAMGTGSGVGSTTTARICRALNVPNNGGVNDTWGVNTGIDVDDDIGSRGAISFWYRANAAWNSGTQRMLVDASQSGSSAGKFFHVSITADGRVRLYIEDSNETDLMTDTARQSVGAGTWKHIAVTWDLPNDRYRIYIDGSLAATGTDNSNGSIGELQTLYVGDNRSNYHFGGSNNSANGIIDEVRVYDSVISAADVLDDYNETGSCPTPGDDTPYAEFRFEAASGTWSGTSGEVSDTQGNVVAARALGTAAGVDTTADGKICRAAVIPNNTTEAAKYAIDSGIDVDDDIGNRGAISFWYRANAAWNSGTQRMLLDASQSGGSEAKFFHVSITTDGRVRFYIEDSGETDLMTDTAVQAVAAQTWKHIAVTWDLPNDRYRIYIDGNLAATGTDNSNGNIGELQTLYVGDNRSNYHFGGSNNSADGTIDEVRVYRAVISAAQVTADYNRTRTCPPPGVNTPYAEFRLEEPAGDWSGVPGEVADTQGTATGARALGTTAGVDTTEFGKICRGGVIPYNTTEAASYVIDTGVDVDGQLGNAGAITFWYRSNQPWNGGGNRMLFDASHDGTSKYFYLMLQNDGSLSFRLEDSADVGLSSTSAGRVVAANTWKHIGVTWDLPNDRYRVYVDGGLAATGTSNSTGVLGSLQTLVFGDNRGSYHYGGTNDSANGVLDELRLYDRVLTGTEILADFQQTRSCDVSSAGDAGGFNCVVAGGNALNGHLYLQLVGTAFGFDVVALRDDDDDGDMDAIETAFASDGDRALTVELVDASGGGACATRPALSPTISQTLTLSVSDQGRKAAAAMSVTRAYRRVGCRVTDPTSDPNLVACSTDAFTVRPVELTLAAPALNNAGALGLPRAAAGSPFSLSVIGGPGYDGTPKIDNTELLAHAAAVHIGVLSGGFDPAAGASGTASGSDFRYAEVGNLRFATHGLYDDSFASDDAADGDCSDDFSNVAVGGRFGCKFGNSGDTAWIGRFHPAELEVTAEAVGSFTNSCELGGFSYQGEEISLADSPVWRVTARNVAGEVTQNYTGAYAGLMSTDFVFAPIIGDAVQPGVDASTPIQLAWSRAGGRTLTDNVNGTLDLSLVDPGFTWGRGANDRVAPFDGALDLSVTAVQDRDGVVASGLPLTATPVGVELRYGRLAFANAHGSELQHLAVRMQSQHFAGSAVGFVLNTDDSCSVVPALGLTDLDVGDSLAVADTCVWDVDDDSGLGCATGGPGGMEFESLANAGLFNLNLQAPGAGNVGVLEVGATVPSHLMFDWDGAGDRAPTARATFGIFNRPSSIVYRRELR